MLRCSSGTAFGILSGMFSEAVLDHFRNPRNAGDLLKLSARIADGRIAEARFLCRGCTTSIACASMLTEKLIACAIADARIITADSLSESLGGLPATTFHGAQLAADAVTALLQELGSAGR